jgi:DNA-binding MarR family transcriptional regulator
MIGRMMFDLNGYGHGHTMYHEAVTKAAFHFGTITEDHARIITWLGQNPGLQSVQDVIEGVALDEKTVMKGLRHLVRTELLEIQVDEKHGVRRYQSTDLLKSKDQEEFITNRKILGNYLSGAWKYGRMRGFAFTLLLIGTC